MSVFVFFEGFECVFVCEAWSKNTQPPNLTEKGVIEWTDSVKNDRRQREERCKPHVFQN